MFSNHVPSLLLLGTELPECSVSEQEHSCFSCSLASAAVPLNFWQWNFYRQNLTPCSMALDKEKACFWACVPTRPFPSSSEQTCVFYLCILRLSFRYLGSLFFPQLSSHMIISIYKLSGIIHISFYALTVGFSKARV